MMFQYDGNDVATGLWWKNLLKSSSTCEWDLSKGLQRRLCKTEVPAGQSHRQAEGGFIYVCRLIKSSARGGSKGCPSWSLCIADLPGNFVSGESEPKNPSSSL